MLLFYSFVWLWNVENSEKQQKTGLTSGSGGMNDTTWIIRSIIQFNEANVRPTNPKIIVAPRQGLDKNKSRALLVATVVLVSCLEQQSLDYDRGLFHLNWVCIVVRQNEWEMPIKCLVAVKSHFWLIQTIVRIYGYTGCSFQYFSSWNVGLEVKPVP